ncbi:uncharacterized protein LOC121852918 [Callorhinchus milii]|uniref:uncharacterized protein LOC121852918 n=1 Tax=Callorhinchus milii TaxID=7868 RepID=UPI001C3FF020|nr:uncharacterized protein LOC121852918 [Callorhinchus milii]
MTEPHYTCTSCLENHPGRSSSQAFPGFFLGTQVDNFNKIIQFADQRLQLNNLQILRLEKKNSALLAALNKKRTKKLAHKESKSSGSLSDSSRMGGMFCGSIAEQNNHNEVNTCTAKGTCEQLRVGNEESQKQSQDMDNFESEEGACSLYQLENICQPDIGSNSNTRDEVTDEFETINTGSEISQEEVDNKDVKEEKGITDFNASSCGKDRNEEFIESQHTAVFHIYICTDKHRQKYTYCD